MRFVLLLIAAVVAVAAGVAALQMSGKTAGGKSAVPAQVATQGSVSTVDILVARQPIPVGTTIDESMVDKQPWPENLLLEGFITAAGKDSNIVGKVTRSSFQAHEPFMNEKLANPNDPSFLAAALPHGMRAVTVATDAVSGVAGYVFPGDRIDVLLTHNVPQDVRANSHSSVRTTSKPAITEVLVNNARVLAVNVRAVAGNKTGTTNPSTPSSITIEAADADVEKLRLGEKVGTLSLALRSLKDKDDTSLPNPIMLDNLTRVHLAETQDDDSVKVVRGVGNKNQPSTQAQPVYSMFTTSGQNGAPAPDAAEGAQ